MMGDQYLHDTEMIAVKQLKTKRPLHNEVNSEGPKAELNHDAYNSLV